MSDEKIYSKLGKVYSKREIEVLDKKMHKRLKELRAQGANSMCAECGASPTNWASVSLGVFVCTDCAQVHRGLGAHVSKVKSCMGTYLWCPDELAVMEAMGNDRANEVYGVPPPAALPRDFSMGGSLFVRAQNRYEKGLYKSRTPAALVPKVPKAVPKPAVAAAPVPEVKKQAAVKTGWEWDDLDF
eukprot:TRINITY_DN2803_c10_g1_i1.p1 TRINITY_DN2803_c10_g1~~TRINITY_DN2803_c10_g1_i1.p1  ORF type:complete len:186 (+),score=50.80 TRINITY_DN2803_c10_g1_i1:58-615(+)